MTICRDAAACANEAHKNQMHCTSSKEYSESKQQRNDEQQLGQSNQLDGAGQRNTLDRVEHFD